MELIKKFLQTREPPKPQRKELSDCRKKDLNDGYHMISPFGEAATVFNQTISPWVRQSQTKNLYFSSDFV